MSVTNIKGTPYEFNSIADTVYSLMNEGIPVMPFVYVGDDMDYCYSPSNEIQFPYQANVVSIPSTGTNYGPNGVNENMYSSTQQRPTLTKAFLPPELV